ncbi:MAG TPA: hypothetical protein VL225_18485 [Vicinamibacterales bacterium]|nr:hypothetical protein [Vicinamibacterales bacterium]
MTCLNDIQIQALVDGEGTAEARQHAASCPACAARAHERTQQMTDLEAALDVPIAMPPRLEQRVEETFRFEADATGSERGATRLRTDAGGVWRGAPGLSLQAEGRRWAYSGVAVAAATLIAVLIVAPMMKGPTTVSAAEILAKSASQLAAAPAAGVEFLEYELVLDGVPREVMPDHANGAYRVKQIIDHTVQGRFRFASYDPAGLLLSSIAQDPATGRRVMAMRVDDRMYRFETTLPATLPISVPEIERLHMQASVAMMQASGNQRLQILDTPRGRQYRIDVPSVSAATPAAVWDLTEGHVIVDAADFHIVEFAVKGAFLKQAYSFSYRLLTHDVVDSASVAPDTFEVPLEPGTITLHGGEGSPVPAADAFVIALRELSKARQAR